MSNLQKCIVILYLGMINMFTGCTNIEKVNCFNEPDQKSINKLKILENGNITLGLIPDCGGHIVYLKPKGGYNLLFSDPESWSAKEKNVNSIFDWVRPVNGHTLWLSPQKEWWAKQNLYPEDVVKRLTYTPDPYIVFGNYEIVDETATSITLRSPKSPVSMVSIEKKIELLDDSSVAISYKMTNTADKEVAWGMWSNTRFNGHAVCYAPIDPLEKIEISVNLWQPETRAALTYNIIDQYFYFDSSLEIPINKDRRVAKAFLSLRQGRLFTFIGPWLVIKESKITEKNLLPPDHAFAEIYQNVERESKTSLLEVEMNSPYYKLKPGETATFDEKWKILPYTGNNDRDEHVSFIKELL